MKVTTNIGMQRSQSALRKFISACSALYVVLVLVHAQAPAEGTVPLQAFVGTWVGTQRWASDVKSPGAVEEQEVTLTLDEFNGKLVGSLTPFFGGSDGVTFLDGELVGGELRATARFGQPRAGEPAAESRNQPRGWKDATRIQFAFSADRNNLKGTADIQLNGVKWLKFNYDLSKKRSRY
jgi:hypothetical protein